MCNEADFKRSIHARFSLFGIETEDCGKKILPVVGGEKLGLEIRYDPGMYDTERVYIETHIRGNYQKDKYMEAGIWFSDGVHLYGVGNFRSLYVFEKAQLQFAHLLAKNPSYGMTDVEFEIKESGKGFTISERMAEEWAEFHIHYKHKFIADFKAFSPLIRFLTGFERPTLKQWR